MKLLIIGCFGLIGFNFIKHVANNFPNDFKLIGIDNLSGQLSNVNKIFLIIKILILLN